MESFIIYPFVSDSFHSAEHFGFHPCDLCISIVHSSLWLSSIPLYDYMAIYLITHILVFPI